MTEDLVGRIDSAQFPQLDLELMSLLNFRTALALGDVEFRFTSPAIHLALGLDWDRTTVEQALHYFTACTQMKFYLPDGSRPQYGPEFDFSTVPLFHDPTHNSFVPLDLPLHVP